MCVCIESLIMFIHFIVIIQCTHKIVMEICGDENCNYTEKQFFLYSVALSAFDKS